MLILEVWAWLGCAVFLLWPHAVVLAVGLVPVGLAVPSTDSVVNGYRIAVTPDRLLGRAESVRSAIALSAASLAPLAAGAPPAAHDAAMDGGVLHRLGLGPGHLGHGEPYAARPATARAGYRGP